MDAKAHELVLLAALSLFCAGFAWILDQVVLGSVLFALGVVAVGAAWARQPRPNRLHAMAVFANSR
jgi:hypothetical protein